MPNPILSVPVGFNYNSGSPIWAVQNKISVAHGDIDTIQWNLTCTGLPTGTTGRFAMTNPINFVVRKGNNVGAAWTGPGPTRVNDTQVSVDDDNRGPSNGTQDYYYSVNLELVTGGVAVGYTYDPEVENVGT